MHFKMIKLKADSDKIDEIKLKVINFLTFKF